MSSAAGVPAPSQQFVKCPRCRRPIPLDQVTTAPEFICPLCNGGLETVRFYPPERHVTVAEVASAGPVGAHPCAIHARNAAVAACQRCGMFMCTLCRIDVDQKTLCPPCFERLAAEGQIESARTRFRDYGGLSSASAALGCFMWILAPVLGVLTIFYGIKSLRQKRKMGEREGRLGVWLAMTLGLVEIGVSIFLIWTLFRTTGHTD